MGPPYNSRLSRTAQAVAAALLLPLMAVAASQEIPAGFGVPIGAARQSKGPKVRTVDAGPDISRRPTVDTGLRGDDEIVEIVDWQPLGLSPPLPEGETLLDYRVRQAAAVAVVEIRATEGRRTPDSRWIDTRVTARVRQILKSPNDSSLMVDGEVVFASPGGQIVIEKARKQIVRAGRRGDLPFVRGQSYLVLLMASGEGWRVLRREAAAIVDDMLIPLATEDISPLGRGQGLPATAARISAAASRKD